MRKKILSSVFLASLALISCNKNNSNSDVNGVGREFLVGSSETAYPVGAVNFPFDNDHGVSQVINNVSISGVLGVNGSALSGSKLVQCSKESDVFTGGSNTTFTSGSAIAPCTVDVSNYVSTDGTKASNIFLKILGSNQTYRINVFKLKEFSNPIASGIAGYTIPATTETFSDAVSLTLTQNAPFNNATQIADGDTYKLVYRIIGTDVSSDFVIDNISGANIAGTYSAALDLSLFENEPSVTVKAYFVNTNATPAAGINKTIAVSSVVITNAAL
jgi:hypothetical protein